jgi:hypothetical protein
VGRDGMGSVGRNGHQVAPDLWSNAYNVVFDLELLLVTFRCCPQCEFYLRAKWKSITITASCQA